MSHEPARYDLFSRLLHWGIAAVMIYVMIVGYSLHFMTDARIFAFFSVTNMSLALVLTPLMAARFIWRFSGRRCPMAICCKGTRRDWCICCTKYSTC